MTSAIRQKRALANLWWLPSAPGKQTAVARDAGAENPVPTVVVDRVTGWPGRGVQGYSFAVVGSLQIR
jgi:hypothetical protein